MRKVKQIPPKSHDLEYLAEKAGLNLQVEDSDFLTEMNQFVLEARYPDEKLDIYKKATKIIAESYFKRTIQFTTWLKEIVKQ